MQIINNNSSTNKVWLKYNEDTIATQKISQLFSIDVSIAKILYNRSVALEEIGFLLNPKLKDSMPDPYTLKDMSTATNIVIKHIKEASNIVILGDYDVDGITSTTILYKYLINFSKSVYTHIPERYTEGYGITKQGIDKIVLLKPKLVILLDNGSSALEEVDILKRMKIDVIIIDHHAFGVKIPNACAIINPQRDEDTSNLEYLASVGLTFMFIVALNKHIKNEYTEVNVDLMQYLDLVALGTVADLVPLKKLNRAYVIQGLKLIQKRGSLHINSLLDALLFFSEINVDTLAYSLSPTINAASRMGNGDFALKYFLNNNKSEIENLALSIVSMNKARQGEESKIVDSVLHDIESTLITENYNFIFKGSVDYKSGIIGIVASRVKDIYNKPSCIFSISENSETATASGRSVENINLGNIIIGAKERGLIIKGGGHSQAVGFTFYLHKKQELENFISKEISKIHKLQDTKAIIKIDDILNIMALNDKLINNLKLIEPFGMHFNEPIFMLANVKMQNVKHIGLAKNHLSMKVSDGLNYYIQGFCYKSVPGKLGEAIILNENKFVNLLVTIKNNFYKGKYYNNIIIKDVS